MKKKIAFYDVKPYDRKWFDEFNKDYEIVFFEAKLNENTAVLAKDFDGVIAFVNDRIDKKTIDILHSGKVEVLALRSAGYNNVDVKAAYKKIHILRVPDYSPYAVAEHAAALLLALNRKIHKAYNRTREFNFSLNALTGFDLNGKTIGIIGTGKIGRVFAGICKGFNLNVIAYDPYPSQGLNYVSLEELFAASDIISLHCPLTVQTRHILNADAFKMMKNNVFIINTSRGALIDSAALLDALNNLKVGAAGLDVYEEEENLFFEDFSSVIVNDDILSLLVSRPNVIITSHQAFLTDEALKNIADTTLSNLDDYFQNRDLLNEICYKCKDNAKECFKNKPKRCF